MKPVPERPPGDEATTADGPDGPTVVLPGQSGAAAATAAAEPPPGDADRVRRRARRLVVAACLVLWVTAPAVLAAARWPQWWTDIAPEQTPMTWLQSVVLVVAAVIAALNGLTNALARTPVRGWAVLAAGFTGLAIDERFALHERIRDGYLAPRGVAVPFLPWVAPGDFLLLFVGVVGLAVLPMAIRATRTDRGARRALLVGVGLAVLAVGMDSIDPSTWTVTQERFQQSAEECIELASGLALLTAALLTLIGRLPAARPAGDATGVAGRVG